MRKALCVLIFLFLSQAGLPLSGPEQEKADEIMSRLEKRYDSTETVSCQFTQMKKISQLEGVAQLRGRLYFKKPHFLRLEFQGEENLIIYCNGKSIWLEDLDLDEVEVHDFSALGTSDRLSRFLLPVFMAGFEGIRREFTIRTVMKEGAGDRLELVPKPGAPYAFQNLRFDVDGLSRISWMKIVYGSGDFTEMKFWNWRTHPEISDHFFEYLKIPTPRPFGRYQPWPLWIVQVPPLLR